MNLTSAFANRAWLALNRPGHRRFLDALDSPRGAQESLLRSYLKDHADTAYGRAHGFAEIRSFEDFQARVPLVTYDDLHPFVERIAKGEERVLTRDPVKLFEPSSGSTRAAKWIPYTRRLQAEIRSAVAPWIVDLYTQRPTLRDGPAYWSITPFLRKEDQASSVVPVGFEQDTAYLGGLSQKLVDAALAVPSSVRRIQDVDDFRRVTLHHLLLQRELRLISVWHPSYLSLLCSPLTRANEWEARCDEVRRGIEIPELGLSIPADPTRAAELSALAPGDLPGVWPHLALISCWGDSHAALHLAELRELFPDVEIQPKGLIATEAFVTLPFADRTPLAITSHIFEFEDAAGRVLPSWDLEVGADYSVVVTTGGGLYRYRLRDRVEVTGLLGETPCLRFLGKEDRVSDLFGEKLDEGFVAQALDRVLDRDALGTRFELVAPERDHYVLYVESAAAPPRDLPDALDDALRENPHYDGCIRLGQLAPMEVVRVPANAYERYASHLTERGLRLGDIKPAALSSLDGWRSVLAP